MNLSRAARRALAATHPHLFRLMLETAQRVDPDSPVMNPETLSIVTNVQIRGIATSQFQKAVGLKVDGHPGTATFSKLWSLNRPTLEDFVERAERAASPENTLYELGSGGYGWFEDDLGAEADCSGFIAHCLGISRKPSPLLTSNQGVRMWLSTDSIHADAKGKQCLFAEVEAGTPDSIIVYPDYRANGRSRQGHVGFVREMRGTVPWGWDCSWSQGKKGDAVTYRSLAFFNRKKRTVWCKPTWWAGE